MAKALIIGEIKNGFITKASLEIASKVKALGMDASALVFGEAGAASEFGKAGIVDVNLGESSVYNGEAYAKAVTELVQVNQFTYVFLPHTWMGRDLTGRLSALLKSVAITDIVDMELKADKLVVRKPLYAGKAYASLASKDAVKIFSIRPNAFDVAENQTEAKVTAKPVDSSTAKAVLKEFKASSGSKIGLTEASIIVSGGRGIKGPEFFPVLQELADLLGAALGASRATVDAGWIDHSHQVGQTGKTVSPNLYIAVGISGAIQHLAGMGSSKYIVAINKDADAPIFKVTTYGVVDDLFDVIPPLKDIVKKLKG
jgi:electron transfer flavoprotein alpha subunit